MKFLLNPSLIFNFVITLLLFINFIDAFYVAVVEVGYNAEEIENINIKTTQYIDVLKKVKTNNQPLDLIVYPEDTLSGFLGRTDQELINSVASIVPDPSKVISPCAESKNFADFLVKLSCASKQYNTYMVINIKEKEQCQKGIEGCPSDGYLIYNTNVVFDRNGAVIARYRKFNLFGEGRTNSTLTPDLITFKTDFGETFGVFTCFDLVFDLPGLELVRRGVKNFVFPTMWFSELPFLTALQAQQMWAEENDVLFLAAGANNASIGGGGSGIYLGSTDRAEEIITIQKENVYVYKKIDRNANVKNYNEDLDANDEKALSLDRFALTTENLKGYTSVLLNDTTPGTTKQTVCQENGKQKFCCNFKIDIEIDQSLIDQRRYNFHLLARSGMRTYGGIRDGVVENCGVVACVKKEFYSCGKRFPKYSDVSWPITFKSIEVEADFINTPQKKQFPSSLLADLTPISPVYTTWKKQLSENKETINRSFKLNVPIKKLYTFGIFGRDYSKDSPRKI